MDNLITATQYAAIHKLSDRTVRHKAQTGQFKTATKKGKTWYIDRSEDFPTNDGRITTGQYVDWRVKYGRSTTQLQNPLDTTEGVKLQNPPVTIEPLRLQKASETTEP